MDGWDGRDRRDGWKEGRMGGRKEGRKDGRMEGRKDGWMDGMDGWIDGWLIYAGNNNHQSGNNSTDITMLGIICA